jgi:dCMP deaminase
MESRRPLPLRFMSVPKQERPPVTDAAKRGVSIDGAEAYVTHYPCLNCYKALASSGVKKIYYNTDYKNDPVVEELGYDVNVTKL